MFTNFKPLFFKPKKRTIKPGLTHYEKLSFEKYWNKYNFFTITFSKLNK